MGREVCRALAARPDLELTAAVDPAHAGTQIEGVSVASSLDAVVDASAEVAVDFTHPDAVMGTIRWCVEHGVHAVVGTTGITPENLDELRAITSGARANVFVAPNFAIGAVLMMRFAERAAKYFPAAEIVELHHDDKADAPSGTALATARRIAAARGDASAPTAGGDEAYPGARGTDVEGVRVHAVRLPGLLAHQEVILGGPGQTLTIRHDSTDRSAFIPGILLAIESVAALPGLTIGIEPLLEER
ncbi:MAG: 4-hydroxy-tetrahydrodipicolinate reductase [Actinomycetota bacterium]|nr:4-hydroxy-tetrahydrodipicolinate reductase [Actinomycetota bacterium]